MLWKKWKKVSRGEYWFAKIPEHPKANSNGYILEHRAIMENIVGRILSYNEIVHHKNKNRKDNSHKNLLLIQRGEHTSQHNKEKGVMMVELCCPFCRKIFHRSRNQTALINKSVKLNFCSRTCSGKFSHLPKITQQETGVKNIVKEYRQPYG